ncbi:MULTISPECIES: ABC transporter permease subunit [Bacillus amyloliquefaciens group]|uniref:ABC transporter permease subunit n=1 Tax=Bacillus amyloliquefaciens group TaxID=1938374 RepID=UPI001ABC9529|nr:MULTISPECIES: ABC transporter permease subunit [Bacillus amyloliquefaciens group]MBO3651429.1 ABC transporter permease subunit [Bacillus amyloliquefaciens]MCJ2173177.1 ABC transporter permease [Bacillus amyloliquefaciens]MCR4349026.1 ABC transporter permease [Bacillus amyloliquefaciens]MCR4355937.1 ABC transporter permease [Bacillus amyloliquefaciens]MDX7983453.1 ABC transporter permease subunit [Bacillus velezensis]
MVDRGLLYREWVQNRTVLVMVGLFLAAVNPFEVLNTYLVYQGCLDTPEAYCNFYVNSLDSGMLNLNWAPAVILAVCLFGLERTKGTIDTLFSLPYSRAQVFHTKFWLGAAVIAGFQIIGYGLAELLILLLKPERVYFFHHYSVGEIIVSVLAFTLVASAGCLTGNTFAQLLTAFTVSIAPYLIISLPLTNAEVIFRVGMHELMPSVNAYLNDSFQYLIPIMYVNTGWVSASKYILIIPAVMSILFYAIGYFCYVRQPVERNGRFFLWRQLDRPIQIVVIIIAVLGFGLAGYSMGQTMTGYVAGMLVGGAIGFLVSYFAIYKKMKHV